MPVNRDTKKNPFCTSSVIFYFFKHGNFDNNWVGHLFIKPVDAE